MNASITDVTWLLVMDGKKALAFRNDGFDDAPNLKLVFEHTHTDAPNRDLRADRAGRTPDGLGPGASSTQEPDSHTLAEVDFAARIAGELGSSLRAGRFDRLVLLADPASLGHLREALNADVRSRVAAEKPGDHVHQPMEKIDAAFKAALAAAE